MLFSTLIDVPSNDTLSLRLKHWIINCAEMLHVFVYTRLNVIHSCNVPYSIILAALLSLCHFQWTVNLIACLQTFFFHWLNYQKPVWCFPYPLRIRMYNVQCPTMHLYGIHTQHILHSSLVFLRKVSPYFSDWLFLTIISKIRQKFIKDHSYRTGWIAKANEGLEIKKR